MEIYKYKDYEEYLQEQTNANIKKERNVWVKEHTIKEILKQENPNTISSILCHGTRNGKEQRLFRKYFPLAEVIGTEISHTASKYEMTIQHDFHDEKEEWINKFDIVYSNSYDHSYDPEKAIMAWKNQLNKTGALYIEQSFNPIVNISDSIDCLKWDNQKEFEGFLDNLNFNFSKIDLNLNFDAVLYRLSSSKG